MKKKINYVFQDEDMIKDLWKQFIKNETKNLLKSTGSLRILSEDSSFKALVRVNGSNDGRFYPFTLHKNFYDKEYMMFRAGFKALLKNKKMIGKEYCPHCLSIKIKDRICLNCKYDFDVVQIDGDYL